MDLKRKQISYWATNTYHSLNTLGPDTKNVWLALHGLGFLSKYFIRYFEGLSPTENYIIAPEAPSKYYVNSKYTRVGASWLTRENRDMEIENVLQYLDGLYQQENIPPTCRLLVLGFSQGVSVAARWVARSKIPCQDLILYAGGIPTELTASDFSFLDTVGTKVKIIWGTQDPYLSQERLQSEKNHLEALFQGKAEFICFEGGHEIDATILNQLL